jgi:hypothetical protein
VVDTEFDRATEHHDGVAVFQLHGTEADPQNVVVAQLPVRVSMRRGHGRGRRHEARHGRSLRAVIASGAINSGHTRERLEVAIATILDAGRADGTLRADVRPADISASMAGIMLTAADTDQATRMLHLLVDGLLAHDHS